MLKIIKQIEKTILLDFCQIQIIKAVLISGFIICCLNSNFSWALIPDNFEKEIELNHNFIPSPSLLQAQEILKELKEQNIDQIALDSTHKCILFNKDTGEIEECSEKERVSIVNSLTGEMQVAGLGDWWNDTLSSFRKSPLCITVSETIGVSSGIISGVAIAYTLKDSLVAGAAIIKTVGAGTLLTIVVVPTVAVAVTMTTIILLCDETEIDLPDWLDYIWYLG